MVALLFATDASKAFNCLGATSSGYLLDDGDLYLKFIFALSGAMVR